MGAQGQLIDEASPKRDTLNTKVVPIVVVPGVMGTRLNIDNSGFDWDPDDFAEMADWLLSTSRDSIRVRLHNDTKATVLTSLQYKFTFQRDDVVDPRVDLQQSGRLADIATLHLRPKPSRGRQSHVLKLLEDRGWGGMVWTFYGKMLIRLAEELNPGIGTSERCPVYACGYDWRKSAADGGTKLLARIKDILSKHEGATQVIVLTHSMGGLVTRAALLQGAEPLIGGVVHTVIPADGAVVAYRRMLTGATPRFGDNPEPLSKIMGSTREEYFITQSGLRGPVELLPSDSYPEPFVRMQANLTNKDFPDIFDAYAKDVPPGFTRKEKTRQRGLTLEERCVPDMKAGLKAASKFTRSIAGKFHPKTFLLFGDEMVTDVEFDWTKGTVDLVTRGTVKVDPETLAPMVNRRAEGDGTVPRLSALFSGSKPLSRQGFKATHAECFSAPNFTTTVIARIKDLLAMI